MNITAKGDVKFDVLDPKLVSIIKKKKFCLLKNGRDQCREADISRDISTSSTVSNFSGLLLEIYYGSQIPVTTGGLELRLHGMQLPNPKVYMDWNL